MKKIIFFLLVSILVNFSLSAEDEDDGSYPGDCDSRRRAMERTLGKVTIVMNPKLRLYQSEGELYDDHCV